MLGGHFCWKASDVQYTYMYMYMYAVTVCVQYLVNYYVVNSLIPLHTACIIIHFFLVVSSILTVFCVRASMYTIQSNPSTHLCTYMYIHGWPCDQTAPFMIVCVCADSPRTRIMKYPILLKEVKKKVHTCTWVW